MGQKHAGPFYDLVDGRWVVTFTSWLWSAYMADTQYFKTETWTETSTGPNKCPNRDLDCVCFNGQDRDCPRPSLVSSPVACTWPVPVPVASLSWVES